MDLKRQQNLDDHTPPIVPQRREKNLANLEKNERLKRSIFERLYSSTNSLTCDDNIMTRDFDNTKTSEIKILTGVVVDESTQFLTVDEIKMPKRPVRVKMRRAPSIPAQQALEDNFKNIEQEKEIEFKPPTPPLVRRHSRSNSLRTSQDKIKLHVVVMPRKNFNQTYIPSESNGQHFDNEHPKSILKISSDENQTHTPKIQHITFVNVPNSSSSSSSSSENECSEDDIWTRIDTHRSQLMRLHAYENDFSEVENDAPPLPKTPPPPPLGEEKPYLREFSFA